LTAMSDSQPMITTLYSQPLPQLAQLPSQLLPATGNSMTQESSILIVELRSTTPLHLLDMELTPLTEITGLSETHGLPDGEKEDISESPRKRPLPKFNAELTTTPLQDQDVKEDQIRLKSADFAECTLTHHTQLEENSHN